jgi:hypothetical protein
VPEALLQGGEPVAAVILKEPGAVTAAELTIWVNERVAARYQDKLERRRGAATALFGQHHYNDAKINRYPAIVGDHC